MDVMIPNSSVWTDFAKSMDNKSVKIVYDDYHDVVGMEGGSFFSVEIEAEDPETGESFNSSTMIDSNDNDFLNYVGLYETFFKALDFEVEVITNTGTNRSAKENESSVEDVNE